MNLLIKSKLGFSEQKNMMFNSLNTKLNCAYQISCSVIQSQLNLEFGKLHLGSKLIDSNLPFEFPTADKGHIS